jgi:tetratricopeptide (TPR) repeat protein
VGERVYLSTRVRYASEEYVRDLLLSRLAGQLSRSLLYKETPYFVELEDPSPGFLRRGIELAREGQWPAAIEEWEAVLRRGDPARKAPPVHYNLGIALSLAGRRDEALQHLRAALEADPGSPRYGKILARVAEEGWPWESP